MLKIFRISSGTFHVWYGSSIGPIPPRSLLLLSMAQSLTFGPERPKRRRRQEEKREREGNSGGNSNGRFGELCVLFQFGIMALSHAPRRETSKKTLGEEGGKEKRNISRVFPPPPLALHRPQTRLHPARQRTHPSVGPFHREPSRVPFPAKTGVLRSNFPPLFGRPFHGRRPLEHRVRLVHSLFLGKGRKKGKKPGSIRCFHPSFSTQLFFLYFSRPGSSEQSGTVPVPGEQTVEQWNAVPFAFSFVVRMKKSLIC